MFGKVLFTYKSGRVEAVLGDDGLWRCDAVPCLVRALNIRHSPAWHGEPRRGPAFRRHLTSAASWLKGEARFSRKRSRRRRGGRTAGSVV